MRSAESQLVPEDPRLLNENNSGPAPPGDPARRASHSELPHPELAAPTPYTLNFSFEELNTLGLDEGAPRHSNLSWQVCHSETGRRQRCLPGWTRGSLLPRAGGGGGGGGRPRQGQGGSQRPPRRWGGGLSRSQAAGQNTPLLGSLAGPAWEPRSSVAQHRRALLAGIHSLCPTLRCASPSWGVLRSGAGVKTQGRGGGE